MSNPVKYTIELEKLPGGGFRGQVPGVSPEPVEHADISWLLTFFGGQIVSQEFGSPMKPFMEYLKDAKPKRKKKGQGEENGENED